MSNYCHFVMRVYGQKDNRQRLPYLLLRKESIGDKYLYGTININVKDSNNYLEIFGDCKWSIVSCYIGTSPDSRERLKEILKNWKENITNNLYFEDICKSLSLDIEIHSFEPGLAFTEHYFINNKGELEIDETTDERVEISSNEKDYYNTDWYNNLKWREMRKPISPISFDPDWKKEG